MTTSVFRALWSAVRVGIAESHAYRDLNVELGAGDRIEIGEYTSIQDRSLWPGYAIGPEGKQPVHFHVAVAEGDRWSVYIQGAEML